MPRDNSNKYRMSSPKDGPLSLCLLQLQLQNLSLNEQVSVCLSEGVPFHWQGRLLLLGGYNHLYYILGPL